MKKSRPKSLLSLPSSFLFFRFSLFRIEYKLSSCGLQMRARACALLRNDTSIKRSATEPPRLA